MANSDLFQADPTTPTDQVDENVNYLEQLVGEGKKFKSPEDLAKGKLEADRFVEQLKRENAELRKQQETTSKLGDVLDKLQNLKLERPTDPPNQNNHTDEDDLRSPGLTPEKIAELIEQRLQARESQTKAQENVARTVSALKEKYGNDFVRELEQRTQALGMTKEEMNALAASRPALVLTLMGVDKTPSSPSGQLFTPPDSSNPVRNNSTGETKRDMAFYQKLKKNDPVLYNSPQTRIQMDRDAIALGEAFFNK